MVVAAVALVKAVGDVDIGVCSSSFSCDYRIAIMKQIRQNPAMSMSA
jgi:hypothetical protein